MKKSFSHFIEQLHHYPNYFLEYQLSHLLEDTNIKTLKDFGFLKRGSDLKEILCQSCDNNHFTPVRVEKGKLYYLCPHEDTERNYLASGEVSTWNFDVEAFLQQLSLNLKIDGNVEKMQIQGLWHIGGFSKNYTRYECYYYQGRNFSESLAFIKTLSPTLRRYIIFTNKRETQVLESKHQLLPIEIKEILTLKNEQLVFSKKSLNEHLINGFRSVIFNKNGDLVINGKRVVTITPSSPEYYFANLLWKYFDEPVADKKIESYVYEKTKKTYADTAEKLCTKLKGKIKKHSTDPTLIHEIFKPTKDLNGENAYMMGNPA